MFIRDNELESEISKPWAPRDLLFRDETVTIEPKVWHNLVFSYEMFDGSRTEVKYYVDDKLMKHENIPGEILVDDSTRPAYIGAEKVNGGFTNLSYACCYDIYFYQDPYDPEENRGEPDEDDDFWTVPLDEWEDEDGNPQPCDPTCTTGCVDDIPCTDDFC